MISRKTICASALIIAVAAPALAQNQNDWNVLDCEAPENATLEACLALPTDPNTEVEAVRQSAGAEAALLPLLLLPFLGGGGGGTGSTTSTTPIAIFR